MGGKQSRILVLPAPDEPSLLRHLAAEEALRLVTAASIGEGRAALGMEPEPDLILLDAGSPLLDCAECCAALAELAQESHIPMLAVADPFGTAHRLERLAFSPDDLLHYPLDPEILRIRVQSVLRVRRVYRGIAGEMERLAQIGIALSREHNIDRLLERIVDEARAINNADAGTLYLTDHDANVLHFKVVQNETLGTRVGGASGEALRLPPVPMARTSVSGYAALTGETVNVPDVYQAEGFDFSGPRTYDKITGYKSSSMLVVPMIDHEGTVIGVLQLINARKPGSQTVVPFRTRNIQRTQALASQAAVSITNARLVSDLHAFLNGLLQVMASAIDEKSAYTSGHIQRVTQLGMLLAHAVNDCPDDRFGGLQFTEAELEELRIAGLLHDIGKIVVPEYIVDKATKLETIQDRIEHIRTRFSVVRRGYENHALSCMLDLSRDRAADPNAIAELQAELAEKIAQLKDDLAFLETINRGGEFMAPEKLERLHAIGARTYTDDHGQPQPLLTEDEVRNLAIARGTLLPEELDVIRSHAAVTTRLLSQVPFSRKLRSVPRYAGDHHECLNGSGYPCGKTAENLPLQSRILAIADISDALTASDRPYKKAYSLEVAHRILREEAERGKLDKRLVELFIQADCHRRLHAELSAPNPADD